MIEVSICSVEIPERYIKHRYDTSTLAFRREQVHVKRTSESEKILNEIRAKVDKSEDKENILFKFDGRERLGAVDFHEEENGTGYIIVLTVT